MNFGLLSCLFRLQSRQLANSFLATIFRPRSLASSRDTNRRIARAGSQFHQHFTSSLFIDIFHEKMQTSCTLAVPNLILPNFGKFAKKYLTADLILKSMLVGAGVRWSH